MYVWTVLFFVHKIAAIIIGNPTIRIIPNATAMAPKKARKKSSIIYNLLK